MAGETLPGGEKPYELSEEGLEVAVQTLARWADTAEAYDLATETAVTKEARATAQQHAVRARQVYDTATGQLDMVLPRKAGTWHELIQQARGEQELFDGSDETEQGTTLQDSYGPEYME